MERKPISFEITITVSDKTGNNTTPSNSAIANAGGYLRQMIVSPPQPSATYDFLIKNANGRTVFKRAQFYGEMAENDNTPLPAGTYACYIENASHDGSYECEIIFAEVY